MAVRSIVSVGGPKGAGKTLFIEARFSGAAAPEGLSSTRHKITALGANLAEPNDPGLKKTLGRVRRSIK